MTEDQIAKCRPRLERFLLDLLEPIGRSERRHWGDVYVRGLLRDGERKSIKPMAARLPDGNVQAMQQFIGQSPWEWQEVWARLGRRMTAELEPDSAWVVDGAGFPKQGEDSVGVDLQYSATLGKTASCQVAVSLHHVGEQGSAVLGWRLYLPESWAKDKERRQTAGVPEEVVFKEKWELALDLIDEVRDWGVPDRIVLADAGCGEATEFRDALEERDLGYVVGVAPQAGVWINPPRVKAPKKWDYGDQRPSPVIEVALKAKDWKKVRWREGSTSWLESRFLAMRVQPSHGFVDGHPPHKAIWLLVEWPEQEKEPARYFFCDLPANYTLRRLVRIAKCRWKIAHDYHQLEELGLDHFEGRNWNGWHHHVTLVMLAHSFLTLETLRGKKDFWVDPALNA
jgi:SRSO17 transposase